MKIQKKPLRTKSMKILSEETWSKSTGDENRKEAIEGKICYDSL